MEALRRTADRAGTNKAAIAVTLVAGYLLTIWFSLKISAPGEVSPFWLSNAFIAALVVVLDRHPLRTVMLVAAGLLSLPLFAVFTVRPQAAAIGAAINFAEGVTTGLLALRVLGPRKLLRTASTYVRLVLLAALPAAVFGGLMCQLFLHSPQSRNLSETWRAAFLPHMLGMAITLPALLLLFQRRLADLRRSWIETIAIVAGLALLTFLVFQVAKLPIAFLVSPLLLMSAFRLGPRGSVFGHLVVALVCLRATITGHGVFILHPDWTLADRALIYQAVTLSSAFGVSFCAFIVSDQARLRRLLTLRAESAREARRRALSASRAKSEFLATMSHEIRTPMNSILGFTQLLMHNPGVSATAREQVKVIAEAGGSLMTVLNDILDFSKVEAGQIELHLEPVDLAALSGAVVEIVREPARAKGLALRVELENVEGRFSLDGQRLRQVLLNLLNNAVKFTNEGHILLTAAVDKAGSTVRFEIQDSGIGISQDVVGRLFCRFTQADSSTTRHYGGTGLGLAICKGLVERMGGVIGVESREGFGSTFWFEVPCLRTEAREPTAGGERPAARLNGRVLLVDDHPMNLRLGDTLLRLLGCEVDLAASGEDAVAAASAKVYGAVLMDVHMPGMDGLAAARAIRALDGPNAMVPIIAMSADVMPQNVERCLAAGMVDNVAKPVQLKALYDVLDRWMDEQKRRSAA